MTKIYQYNLEFKLHVKITTPRSAYIHHIQFSVISVIEEKLFRTKYLPVISDLIECRSKYLNHHAFNLHIKRVLLNLGITLNISNTNNQYPIYQQTLILFIKLPTPPKKFKSLIHS